MQAASLPSICSASVLGGEVFDHRNEWDFLKPVPALSKRSGLLITADDGTGPNSNALLQALKKNGNTQSEHIEIKTDTPSAIIGSRWKTPS